MTRTRVLDASQMTNVTSLSSDSLMLTISPVPFLAHAVSQARILSTALRIWRAASRSVVWLPEHTSSLCSTHTGLGVWVSAGPVRLLPALFSNSIRTRATGASRKGKSWNRTKNFLDLKCSHLLLPPISIIKGRVPKKQNENLKLHLPLGVSPPPSIAQSSRIFLPHFFRCASFSWIQVVSQSVRDVFRISCKSSESSDSSKGSLRVRKVQFF